MAEALVTVSGFSGTAAVRVNRYLSARAQEILRRTVVTPDGVPVRDLVMVYIRSGRSPAVARASLSRTLRRLWQAGLVELHGRSGSLGAKQQEARDRSERFEADPLGSYNGYRTWATAIGSADRYGSAEAFLSAKRTQANAMPGFAFGP